MNSVVISILKITHTCVKIAFILVLLFSFKPKLYSQSSSAQTIENIKFTSQTNGPNGDVVFHCRFIVKTMTTSNTKHCVLNMYCNSPSTESFIYNNVVYTEETFDAKIFFNMWVDTGRESAFVFSGDIFLSNQKVGSFTCPAPYSSGFSDRPEWIFNWCPNSSENQKYIPWETLNKLRVVNVSVKLSVNNDYSKVYQDIEKYKAAGKSNI
jgi:hypothetical protein